jgi:hypothetical protein
LVREESTGGALFAWLISHQPTVLFSQNKPATRNQPAVLFSQNKPAPAISHQPTEQALDEQGDVCCWSFFFPEQITMRKKGNALIGIGMGQNLSYKNFSTERRCTAKIMGLQLLPFIFS